MSNEEAMLALAKSNSSLAAANQSLAASNNALAEAILASLTANGAAAAAPAQTEAAAETNTGKPQRGRKSNAQKEAEAAAAAASASKEDSSASGDADPFGDGADNDPFGDGAAPAREYTADDIRTAVLGVRAKDADKALGIIKAVGADTLGKIDKKDYPRVIELCAKEGVTV